MEFLRLWTSIVLTFALFCGTLCLGLKRYENDLLENDVCGLNTEVYSGKCKQIKKCVNLLVEKKVIEVCSFNGKAAEETLVCCSREDFYKSRVLNGENPLNYETCLDRYKHLRYNGDEVTNLYAVNGVDVEAGEFPHMAAIGWLKWNNFEVDWNCGGALITETFVLTAAHCTSNDGRKPNVVRMGDVDLTSPLDNFYIQQFGIRNIVKHPLYSVSTNDNDIALIQISGQVVYESWLEFSYFLYNLFVSDRRNKSSRHVSLRAILQPNISKLLVMAKMRTEFNPTNYQRFFSNLRIWMSAKSLTVLSYCPSRRCVR